MRVDPFAVKRYPRWHPLRLAYKSLTVTSEWGARRRYDDSALPEILWEDLPRLPEVDWESTAVTPLQMQHLLRAVEATEFLDDSVIVEVGCFRGVTTRCLAGATSRNVVAVDPYEGYGGASDDRVAFHQRTAGLRNVIHVAKSSGTASREWTHGRASLIFIDAVHDYVNTSFDIEAWGPKIVPGGILALHDTDQAAYPGTRRAAFELQGRFDLVAHPDNLALFIAR